MRHVLSLVSKRAVKSDASSGVPRLKRIYGDMTPIAEFPYMAACPRPDNLIVMRILADGAATLDPPGPEAPLPNLYPT